MSIFIDPTATAPTTDAAGATVGSIDPFVLHGWLRDGKELAVLDVRELTGFASGHLLLAVPAPRSRLELVVGDLVPRRAARVVVIDGGDGDVAIDAAERLVAGGYEDVHVLVGGTAAWRAAGYELFTGVNSLSKAFGEFVQDTYDPPEITVDELHERFERGDDVLVVDSRPLDEFTRIAIPNGINCPGGELVHRIHDAITSPDQEIVVNCAGRTRAILGAQVLINAGLPNPIRILTDGTSAWEFAGYEPARGGRAQLAAPAPGTPGAAGAARSAQLLRDRFGVRSIGHRELDAYRADTERTLYVFDVRDAVEFRAGHLPGSRSVPGGQLLQATDEFVGTHGARLVLVDGPDGVRATSAAAWLIQLGFEHVEILPDAFADRPVEAGRAPAAALLDDRRADRTLDELAAIVTIGADDVASRLADGARLIDVGPSNAFRDHHIAGARFARRGGLAATLDLLDEAVEGTTVVLTSADGRLALLAAADLVAAGRSAGVELFVLDGGNEGWLAAGRTLSAEPAFLLTDADDVYGLPVDLEQRRAWYRDYVAWGRQAAEQVARDGSITFRAFTPEQAGEPTRSDG